MVKRKVSYRRRARKARAPSKKAKAKAKQLKNAKSFFQFLKENPKDESDSEE